MSTIINLSKHCEPRGSFKSTSFTPQLKEGQTLIKSSECKIFSESDKNTQILPTHSFILGLYAAYEHHAPVCISPDVIWLLICQNVAAYVDKYSWLLRSQFVEHEGKKQLKIDDTRYVSYKQMSVQDYEDAFQGFTTQIKDNIKDLPFVEALEFNFSTTTPIYKSVGCATIMSTFKNYFEYLYDCCGCEIPYIKLLGTEEDWKLLILKFETVSKTVHFKCDIRKILLKILKSVQGDADLEFWRDMIHKDQVQEAGPSGIGVYNVDAISGWILNFYDRDLVNIKKLEELRKDICETPLTMKSVCEGTNSFTIHSGFIGMSVDKKDHCLFTPEVGWYITCENPNE